MLWVVSLLGTRHWLFGCWSVSCWHLPLGLMGVRLMTCVCLLVLLVVLNSGFNPIAIAQLLTEDSFSVTAYVLFPPEVPATQPTHLSPSHYLSRGILSYSKINVFVLLSGHISSEKMITCVWIKLLVGSSWVLHGFCCFQSLAVEIRQYF